MNHENNPFSTPAPSAPSSTCTPGSLQHRNAKSHTNGLVITFPALFPAKKSLNSEFKKEFRRSQRSQESRSLLPDENTTTQNNNTNIVSPGFNL